MPFRYVLAAPEGVARDVLVTSLWNAGAQGIWERDDRTVVAWFDVPTGDVPSGGRWEEEPPRDWLAAWKAGLEPVTVGRLEIAPSWTRAGPSPTTIVLDPGMAFGTGHHATTRRCLAELQRRGVDGGEVLDVGTGSGVLAIAAVLLGARRAVGVETDPDAVRTARDNAARNGVAVDLRHGSLEALGADERFDVVVANLITDVVIGLAARLLDRVRPGGTLITSGISRGRAEEVARLLAELTGAHPATTVEGAWAAVTVPARR